MTDDDRMTRKGPRMRACPHMTIALAVVVAAALPSPATAADTTQGRVILVEELPEFRYLDVIEALDDAGYRILSVGTTLLNRVRIRASNDRHVREIVVSRSTGEILRDAVLQTHD